MKLEGFLCMLKRSEEDDLLLDWSVGFCSNDYAYFKYGNFEELNLSNEPENPYVSYKELYRSDLL